MAARQPKIDPRYRVLLEALCCVMVSDGKIEKSELKSIADIISKARAPFTSSQINSYITDFVSRVKEVGFDSVAQSSIQQLATHGKKPADRRVYLQSLTMLANADGVMDPKEEQLILKYKNALATIDSPIPIGTTSEAQACPQCQIEMSATAVLCVACGFDTRTSKQVVTEYGIAVEDRWRGLSPGGRRFTIEKDENGVPSLVYQRRFLWFFHFPTRKYKLRNYREIATSCRDIATGGDDSSRARVIGHVQKIHLVPAFDSKRREIVFGFTYYYSHFSFDLYYVLGLRKSYGGSHNNYRNIIQLIQDSHPIHLVPRY